MKSLGLLVLAPSLLLADISATITLTGDTISLDSGVLGAFPGDLSWSGSVLSPRGSAEIADIGPAGASSLPFMLPTTMPFLVYSKQPLSASSLTVNEVFAVKTNAGKYSKVLVTGVGVGSITLQYYTYGATGGSSGSVQPFITSVQNSYAQITPGLPNFGIAPSSLLLISGVNLSSITTELLSSAPPGLPLTLGGVSVNVIAGGQTFPCPLFHLSPTQLDAILPGSTPLGTALVVVTNSGRTSPGFAITVAATAIGILHYNGTLAGAYDGDNQLLTFRHAANPNQTIALWGSGIGHDPSSDDRVFPQPQNNLTDLPMRAYIGEVQAEILYRGRSQYPGLDQIILTIPPDVPTGCFVSMRVVTGTNLVSNTVTLPIASFGRICDEPNLKPDDIETLSQKLPTRTGSLTLTRTSIFNGATSTSSVVSEASGQFQLFPDYTASLSGGISSGSCLVTDSFTPNVFSTASLDAGKTLQATGSQGSVPLTPSNVSGRTLYSAVSMPPAFIPSSGGRFTFSSENGGNDIARFDIDLTVREEFTWSNISVVGVIDRGQGATVAWSAPSSGSLMIISGSSTTTVNGIAITVTFNCQSSFEAGRFTIPASALLALPAGPGTLTLTNVSTAGWNLEGLDRAQTNGATAIQRAVRFN